MGLELHMKKRVLKGLVHRKTTMEPKDSVLHTMTMADWELRMMVLVGWV